ncbi:putative sphingolipid c9-methyltransferase [Podospora conica]|nr:putative sphingolipid c9-methyltransferase [Schizothecium conicum]
MSTAPLPDLSTQTTASEIFSANHPLPQIRAIHKALHARLDDTAARLRTQVGGSYRELLGTADAIVAMRSDMDTVQASLGRMGSRCGRAVVARKVGGLGRFVDGGDGDAGGQQARERLLEGVVLSLAGVLREKKAEGLVLAARLWVLGRLLVKSFGGKGGERVRVAEKGLETSHRRLLRVVEGVLGRSGGRAMERGDVLRALGAYSLATSSGARDVLRHFLRVRGQAMALSFDGAEDEGRQTGRETKDVLRCLGLYTKTLQDVQTLVPHKLTEALMSLKRNALLADESLRKLEGLRLDVYKRWCGDEIQYYTPFIRHDDLDLKQARDMLTSWSKEGSAVLLRGLEATLENMTEFKTIIDLRTSVLTLWIQEGSKARGFDPSLLLNALRASINTRLLALLTTKTSLLHLVGSEISATLTTTHPAPPPTLWSTPPPSTSSAAPFTAATTALLHGRTDPVSRVLTAYTTWTALVASLAASLASLRRQRWDSDHDLESADDDDAPAARHALLSVSDPDTLTSHLHRSLAAAFSRLDAHIAALWTAHRDDDDGHVAMYLLRVLRDIRARLPDDSDEGIKAFGLACVPALHEAVAEAVAAAPLREFAAGPLARRTVAGRALWEGRDPELPSSPSPGVFRFLRDLCLAMSDGAGGDLWSPTAVGVLKGRVGGELRGVWGEAVASAAAAAEGEEGAEEEEGKDEEGEDEALAEQQERVQQRRDLFVQWLFDVAYLRCCLDTPESGELAELEDVVYEKSGLESTAARERVARGAQEYWKRTSLLFGLLA